MFSKRNDRQPQNRIDTLIGVGTQIDGNVRFAGGLRIDGKIKGNVEAAEGASSSTLVLSEQAQVEGTVNVAHFVVNGTVVGPVTVTESLEIQPKGRIVGDVQYGLIEMHQGAVIEGRLIHQGKEQGKAVELKLAASN